MANLLTGIRLLLVIPTALVFAGGEFLIANFAVIAMVIAIASDYFDGKVARMTKTASARGQVFDHATDFLFVTCCLSGAAYAGHVNSILPVLIVVAFTQYVLDSYYFYHEKQLHMSFLGRLNGVFYFVPLCLIAASSLEILDAVSDILLSMTSIVCWILVGSTVLSIIDRSLAPMRSQQSSSQ
jgi:CDP-diacylglycerol--glycerol-3-phosphate 3-phosphatidyltransferase